ncbi:hypothetical protein N9Y92_00185 [Chlamydiales bacterium]|nr:hypothetical protein [Chlamydiales bacterium]
MENLSKKLTPWVAGVLFVAAAAFAPMATTQVDVTKLHKDNVMTSGVSFGFRVYGGRPNYRYRNYPRSYYYNDGYYNDGYYDNYYPRHHYHGPQYRYRHYRR